MSKPFGADESRAGLLTSKSLPLALTATEINTALAAFGYIRLPLGTTTINTDVDTITLPSNCRFEGSGRASILNLTGTGTGIEGLGVDDVTVENMTIVRDAAHLGIGEGIQVYGDNIVLRRLWITNNFVGINVVDRTNIDGLQSGEIRIENVHVDFTAVATAGNSQYAILLNTCDRAILWAAYETGYWLDGVKGRREVLYFQYVIGASNDNGQSLGAGASGDGVDLFAGANSSYISGVTFKGNGGNAIVYKTIKNAAPAINPSNPEWGAIRSHRVEGILSDGNQGSAVAIEGVVDATLAPAERARPRVSQFHILNCVSQNDLNYGFYLNGFQITLANCTVRNSGLSGIEVGPQARDVTISDSLLWGAGYQAAATHSGIAIRTGAERVSVTGTRHNGKEAGDAIEIITDASYVPLVTTTKNPILVETGTTNISVVRCVAEYHTDDPTPYGIPVVSQQVGATDLLHVVHTTTQGNPNNRFYGSIGSIIYSSAGAGLDTQIWVKCRGLSSDTTGWFPVKTLQDGGWYGDGFDGDVVIAGVVPLARDMYYRTLHVQNGGILETNGYRVHVQGNTTSVAGALGFTGAMTVDVGGIVRCNGSDAIAGAGGVAVAAGSLPGRVAGGAGGVGAGAAGAGNNTTTLPTYTGTAGAGGAGAGGAGAAAGTAAAVAANAGGFNSLPTIASGMTHNGTAAQGGPSGGGGRGDGAAAAGGGGGGGGGVMIIVARSIANNGAIECKGGNGAAGTANDCGGGGGGAGGVIFLVGTNGSGTPSGNAVDVAGGLGGASGGGAGVAGADGTAGKMLFVVAP
jgi:hypothetical protein